MPATRNTPGRPARCRRVTGRRRAPSRSRPAAVRGRSARPARRSRAGEGGRDQLPAGRIEGHGRKGTRTNGRRRDRRRGHRYSSGRKPRRGRRQHGRRSPSRAGTGGDTPVRSPPPAMPPPGRRAWRASAGPDRGSGGQGGGRYRCRSPGPTPVSSSPGRSRRRGRGTRSGVGHGVGRHGRRGRAAGKDQPAPGQAKRGDQRHPCHNRDHRPGAGNNPRPLRQPGPRFGPAVGPRLPSFFFFFSGR